MAKQKKFKTFTATSKDMEVAMEALMNSDNYIVCTVKWCDYNGDGNIGQLTEIHHQMGGPANTAEELRAWAHVMDDKASHQAELKDILDENGIDSQ